jgi:hypothetical protein
MFRTSWPIGEEYRAKISGTGCCSCPLAKARLSGAERANPSGAWHRHPACDLGVEVEHRKGCGRLEEVVDTVSSSHVLGEPW